MKSIALIAFAAIFLTGCRPETEQTGSGRNSSPQTASSSDDHIDSLNRHYHLKDLQTVHLKINGRDVTAWLMDDDFKRGEGMKWLTAEDVKDDDGMLFAIRDGNAVAPPMADTYLALDIIYISPQRKVLDVVFGAPNGGDPPASKGHAMFVLEMKQGSAKRLGIVPGTTIPVPAGLERNYQLKDLLRVKLAANGHQIPTWVMNDEGKRREGMMWLNPGDVANDDGMIFAFPDSKQQSFWMHNTVLPLDIIYISPQKKVLNIQEGKSFDESALPSTGEAMFVLEMKQGAARRLGIHSGTVFTIPDSVKGG